MSNHAPPMPRPRHVTAARLLIPIVCALVVSVAAIVVSSGRSTRPHGAGIPSLAQMQAALERLPQHGATLGDPRAPVTLTEFADLQCPYCDAFTLTFLPRIIADYVRPGKVKVVFRNMPVLGADSVKAARVAVAAEAQGKLWQFVDSFYYNQGPEKSGYVTDRFLRSVASSVAGLSADAVIAASRRAQSLDRVKADFSAGIAQGVRATPTLIITRLGRTPQRVVGFRSVITQLATALEG